MVTEVEKMIWTTSKQQLHHRQIWQITKRKQQIKRRWRDYFEQQYNSENESYERILAQLPTKNEQEYVKDFQNRKSKLLKL